MNVETLISYQGPNAGGTAPVIGVILDGIRGIAISDVGKWSVVPH